MSALSCCVTCGACQAMRQVLRRLAADVRHRLDFDLAPLREVGQRLAPHRAAARAGASSTHFTYCCHVVLADASAGPGAGHLGDVRRRARARTGAPTARRRWSRLSRARDRRRPRPHCVAMRRAESTRPAPVSAAAAMSTTDGRLRLRWRPHFRCRLGAPGMGASGSQCSSCLVAAAGWPAARSSRRLSELRRLRAVGLSAFALRLRRGGLRPGAVEHQHDLPDLDLVAGLDATSDDRAADARRALRSSPCRSRARRPADPP